MNNRLGFSLALLENCCLVKACTVMRWACVAS